MKKKKTINLHDSKVYVKRKEKEKTEKSNTTIVNKS